MAWRSRLPAAILAGIVVVGAVLRFATLGDQSFWFDEGRTVHFVNESFGDMLSGVRSPGEAEPPGYFVAAWAWAKVFGDGETGLRSLSAAVGLLTIPVAYAAGRALVNRPVGLGVAALLATSPVMVWYSQEARAYALFIFLCALSFLFFVHALRTRRAAVFAAWAVASSLAMATHYFALFLLVPETLWLLARAEHRRGALAAVGGVGLAGIALLPIALYQREHGGAEWIGDLPMWNRLRDAVRVFATGLPTPSRSTDVVVVIAAIGVLALVLWRGEGRTRRGVALALGIAAATLALPLIGALLGNDYVLDRNLLAAWVPIAVVVASGLGVRALMPVGIVVVAGVVAVFLWHDMRVQDEQHLQRDDWRAVARAIGPPRTDGLVIVAPGWQAQPLALYNRTLRLATSPLLVREVEIVVYSRPGWGRDAPPQPRPGPAFRPAGVRVVQRMRITRYVAPRPSQVDPSALTTRGDNGSLAFAQTG